MRWELLVVGCDGNGWQQAAVMVREMSAKEENREWGKRGKVEIENGERAEIDFSPKLKDGFRLPHERFDRCWVVTAAAGGAANDASLQQVGLGGSSRFGQQQLGVDDGRERLGPMGEKGSTMAGKGWVLWERRGRRWQGENGREREDGREWEGAGRWERMGGSEKMGKCGRERVSQGRENRNEF